MDSGARRMPGAAASEGRTARPLPFAPGRPAESEFRQDFRKTPIAVGKSAFL